MNNDEHFHAVEASEHKPGAKAMSEQPNNTPLFDLTPGLLEYYSSQAELMLAQYDNITALLGPTTDWTASGDFCEILFRDFLRKFLPPSLSADKGFVYGRTFLDGEDRHCPEIDILIHDTAEHRPIFRMGDFVIVKPQAVRGMIQVKRTFSKGPVQKGIRNVVRAKQHLLNLHKDNPKLWERWGAVPEVFTAVVGFADEIGIDVPFYQNELMEWHKRKCTYALPSIIGSLRCASIHAYSKQHYIVYESIFKGKNLFTQMFLSGFFTVMRPTLDYRRDTMPPLAFPTDFKDVGEFSVPQITKASFNHKVARDTHQAEVLIIQRNDGTDDWFIKAPDRDGVQAHIIVDPDGNMTFADTLKWFPNTTEIIVKRGEKTERFMQLANKPSLPSE